MDDSRPTAFANPTSPLDPLSLPDLRTVLHQLIADVQESHSRPSVEEIVARLLAIDGELVKYEALLAVPLSGTSTPESQS